MRTSGIKKNLLVTPFVLADLLTREQLEIAAVDVVRIVAGIAAGPASRIEDETVGAQALSGHAVSAVPVAVAVCVVRVLAVLRVGALEAVGQR